MISEFPPRPVVRPVMFQSWRSLTFLHWPFEPGDVRRLLPREISLDTFNGSAWVGLTPFLLASLRPPLVPALPWISRFPETNVRTYVRGPDGEPGIWFFTLEADRLLAVAGARMFYGLPYRWAKMSVRQDARRVHYESTRHWPFRPAHTNISVEVGEPVQSTEFDRFLTARFRLYTRAMRRIVAAQIEHPPWILREARLLRFDQNLLDACKLPVASWPPHVLHSERTDVRIGRPRLIC